MGNLISINNFRNYDKIDLNISNEDVFIVYGLNGEGKTNLLEALSLFSGMKGLRRSNLDDMIKKDGGPFWNIILELENEIYSSGYKLSNGRGKRIFTVSDKNVRNLSEFKKNYYILWMTYETDRLFLQSPGDRREFIDMFASSEFENHDESISSFEKLSRQRLAILKKSLKDGGALSEQNEKWLDVIEDQIATYGIIITLNRMHIVDTLEQTQHTDEFSIEFTNKMVGKLEEVISSIDDKEERHVSYKNTLRENRIKDFFSGSTTFGPNRSDWKVIHKENGIDASMCSAGEQKILLCSIFFSFIRNKIYSDKRNLLLLLDDVIAHLDKDHRELLFKQVKFLKKYFSQNGMKISIWLSGTDKSFFSEFQNEAVFFHVSNNKITKG